MTEKEQKQVETQTDYDTTLVSDPPFSCHNCNQESSGLHYICRMLNIVVALYRCLFCFCSKVILVLSGAIFF